VKIYKKIDSITALLLFFLASIPLVVIISKSKHENIEIFSKQSDTITTLKLLDKDFNYFIAKKGVFSNYDEINQKILDFESNLSLFRMMLDKTQNRALYEEMIAHIRKDFQLKVALIEHTKSYNSIIVNSLNYLHDLQKNIKTYAPIDEKELEELDEILFLSTQLYMNGSNIYESIKKRLKKLENISTGRGEYIHYFFQHVETILAITNSIAKEQHRVKKLQIYNKLEKINSYLKEDFHSFLKRVNIIMIVLFSIAAMLLLSILYLHRRALNHKKQLSAYKYAIENSDNSIIMTDTDYKITFVNAAFIKETGYSEKEVLGKNPSILKSGIGKRTYADNLKETLNKEKKWEGEFINRRKDGTIFYEKASITPMIIDKKVVGYIAIKLNITEYIEQEKKVKFLAYHDRLTGLANRLQFEHYFNSEVVKKGEKVALMYLDLDRFKTINDTLGHQVGDGLLKTFAKRLSAELSREDFIARIGGDEFVVLLKIKDKEEVSHIAKRVINSLKAPMIIDGNQLNITTSIGIALYPEDGESLVRLLKHADTAMYDAKIKGRNNYQFFTQLLSSAIHERLNLEQALRHALDKNEFYMVYQPKYHLKSREIVGFEALIRWESEKLGFVSPAKFIPVAEEIGLIDEIGYFVFEKACRDFQLFQKINPRLEHIAINVSTVQLKEKAFIETLHQLRRGVGLSAEAIELEVTESYIMDDIEKNIQLLERLRGYGYKIAIDDFGTGYSSFGYLKRLPITTLKIDKSFVDDICISRRDADIIKAIIALAKNLGFDIVAEGIESEEQDKFLQELGCHIGQGYYFCQPKKPGEILSYIEAQQFELEMV
jgi:diguanylate cyclase (GGDEF)-like protein/PAS domain S-box-containing protein